MSYRAFRTLVQVPDLVEGKHVIHLLRTGRWKPIFTLTPDESDRLADQLHAAARHVRENHRLGGLPPEAVRDDHLRVLERPPWRDQHWTEQHSDGLWEAAILGGTLLVIVVVVWALAEWGVLG